MHKLHPLTLAILMATTTSLAMAAQSPATNSVNKPEASAAPVSKEPHIKIDLASTDVALDAARIPNLSKGQVMSVDIASLGRFDYVLDYVTKNTELLEMGGHIVGDDKHKITLGVRSDGLTGLIATPKLTYALGYANKVQMVGVPSSKWMAKELAAEETVGMTIREARKGEKPPARGAEPIDVKLGALSAMKPGDETVMQLTGLGATRVKLDEIRPSNASSTWVGHLSDFGENYTVQMTYSPAGIEGYITTPTSEINLISNPDGTPGDLYQIDYVANGYESLMATDKGCGTNSPEHGGNFPDTESASALTGMGTVAGAAPASTANAADSSETVDLLLYYSPGMVKAYGSVDKVAARVDSLIATANQAYARGGLAYRLRRVGLDPVNVADTNSNDSLLNSLMSRSGVFSSVDARRKALGADVVHVIRPFYSQTQASCGVGSVSGADSNTIGSYDAANAFSILSDGRDHAGQGYYCADTVLAHELGHNMGLMHDRDLCVQQGCGQPFKAYAYGYTVDERWGDLMSYFYPPTVVFSNPLDTQCGNNEPCGLPESNPQSADNVKALSISMPLVAGFQASKAAGQTYGVTGVVTINGKETSGVGMAVSNVAASSGSADPASVSCQSSGSTGVYSCSAPAGYSFTLTPNYPGNTVTWTPASADIAALKTDQTVNFSGTRDIMPTPKPAPIPTTDPGNPPQDWQRWLDDLLNQWR